MYEQNFSHCQWKPKIYLELFINKTCRFTIIKFTAIFLGSKVRVGDEAKTKLFYTINFQQIVFLNHNLGNEPTK